MFYWLMRLFQIQNNLPIVNHKDENPSNYDLSNLEWCDYSYNAKYSIDKIKKAHIKEMKAVIRINPKNWRRNRI